MSVYGTIKNYKIITLESELNNLSNEDRGLISYITDKHLLAEKHDRYIIEFEVDDERFKDKLSHVIVFVPKGVIDNSLIEKNTYIECGSSSCHLKIIGIDDWFDRAYNGASQIHDVRFK